jgi:signal transduction histidine kinase
MLQWLDFFIYSGAQAVSLFNTAILLWLGLTVILTGDRRKPATIAGGMGLLLGALFFLGHTLIIGHRFDFNSRGVNTVWRLIWVAAIAAPFFWGLSIFYYSGDPAAGRWMRRILTAAAFFMIFVVALIFPLPSFWEFLLAPELAPVIAWVYVPYLTLCFALPLVALRGRRRASTGDPFRRARPWLIATAAMLLLAVVGFAFAAYVLVPFAIPVYAMSVRTLRVLYLTDGLVAGFIALAVIFLGRAVMGNSVLTERLQSNQGFFTRWRNVVGVAILGSGFVALLYTAPVPPIYSLLLTAMLAVVAYAMFNWRQYVEHAAFMRRLDPFVKSLHLHDHLLSSHADSWRESRELFTALCRDALGAERACLLFEAALPAVVPHRFDYQWPPAFDPVLARPAVRPIGWARLDGDHWAYPLADSRGAIGRLILGPKLNGNEYTQQELQVAAACAERILDALAGEQLARLAINLLQQRIAQVQVMSAQHKRILHDEVLPQIHLALLKVEALRIVGQDGVPRLLQEGSWSPDKLDEATTALMQTHRRVSGLVREMSNAAPLRLESEGLAAALQSVLDHDFHDSFDRIEWTAEPNAVERARRLPFFASEVVFYAAQEALRNAARHGRGGDAARLLTLSVSLSEHAGIQIVIADDGVGRAASPSSGETGSGLRFHSTMLAVIGGTLNVEDRSGGGTQVTIEVPES